ncbi:unnamed protein product [Clavelina lepadiformis]|uniref:VWFA domain-containing protein n=1 Tax=Clavelina lepadiformis TaxID=159417 RepID=A0ABP0G6Q3_CLALP
MRLRRKTKRFILPVIFVSTCAIFFLLRRSSFHEDEEIRRHHIVKRAANEPLPPDLLGALQDVPFGPAFNDERIPFDAIQGEELLPGNLICEPPPPTRKPKPPKPTAIIIPAVVAEHTEDKNVIINVVDENGNMIDTIDRDGNSVTVQPKPTESPGEEPVNEVVDREGNVISVVEEMLVNVIDDKGRVTSVTDSEGEPMNMTDTLRVEIQRPVKPVRPGKPKEPPVVSQNIGCCPAGDRNGAPYRQGESCCKNIIYNATRDFCCLAKSRVLEINEENERFCYPPSRVPFCRVRDLHLDQRPPLKAQCRNTAGKSKHPNQCTFLCPPGTQIKGDKKVKCNAVGNWDDSDPECCEGCPSSYAQDIWFIVDIDQSIGVGNLSNIRSFVKLLVSYFPVSSDRVQVALTAYNSKLFTNEGTWYLDTYDNHEALERAINMMPMRGSGRKTGEALAWVGENAFEGRLGDRVDVPNTIVLITTGSPDDFTVEEASEVIRGHGRFIVIAAGPDATSSELANIATLPHEVNYLRADYFEELVDRDKKFLYERMCEETCLGYIPRNVRKRYG